MRAGPTKGPPSSRSETTLADRAAKRHACAAAVNQRPSPHDAAASPARPIRRDADGDAVRQLGFQSGRGQAGPRGFRPDHAGRAAIGARLGRRRRLCLAFQARNLAPRRDFCRWIGSRPRVRARICPAVCRGEIDDGGERHRIHIHRAVLRRARRRLCFCRTSDCGRDQWLGMALAFSGVAAGLYRPAAGSSLLGDLLAIAGAAAWGATTILIKTTSLRSADPTKTLLYQIVISALICPLVAYAAGERWPTHVSFLAAASLAYQSIWVVGVTYLVWFWLLRVYRAAELSAFTFVTPVARRPRGLAGARRASDARFRRGAGSGRGRHRARSLAGERVGRTSTIPRRPASRGWRLGSGGRRLPRPNDGALKASSRY